MRVTVHQPTGDELQAHVDQWSPPSLFVNVFDGGPKTTVQCRIGDRDPVSMERTIENDPFMERLYQRVEGTPEAMARPEPSSHLWKAPLPSDLQPGTHTVTVMSVNEFGQTDTTSTLIEVKEQATGADATE
jgi:hypothetical protein